MELIYLSDWMEGIEQSEIHEMKSERLLRNKSTQKNEIKSKSVDGVVLWWVMAGAQPSAQPTKRRRVGLFSLFVFALLFNQ